MPNPRFACESIALRITVKRTRASLLEVKRVLLQRVQRDHCERFLVSRREHDGCRDTGCERFTPGGRAHTPSIARLETAEPVEGRRHFKGTLLGLDGDLVKLRLEDGKETQVPFRPTGARPVYCSDCFRLMRG